MTSKKLRSSSHILLLIFLAGCGWSGDDFEYAKLCKAQGSLTINGKPATGAKLLFSPSNPETLVDKRGSRPHADVDEHGQFQVTTYIAGDGIPVGDYKVAIVWEDNSGGGSAWDKLQSRYVHPDSTQITVTVVEGENQFPPMSLEKVRIVERPANLKVYDKDGVE